MQIGYTASLINSCSHDSVGWSNPMSETSQDGTQSTEEERAEPGALQTKFISLLYLKLEVVIELNVIHSLDQSSLLSKTMLKSPITIMNDVPISTLESRFSPKGAC